jgi:hypothetical protein
MWLSFQVAAEEVERRRGCSWGAAQKAVHFWHWLDKSKPKPQPRKRSRVKAYLADMFHNQRIPDDYSRKVLRADLLKRDKNLYPLDDSTLKSAIDEYNVERRNDPKSD